MKEKEIVTIGCSEYPETILRFYRNDPGKAIFKAVMSIAGARYIDNKITEKQCKSMMIEVINKYNLSKFYSNKVSFLMERIKNCSNTTKILFRIVEDNWKNACLSTQSEWINAI